MAFHKTEAGFRINMKKLLIIITLLTSVITLNADIVGAALNEEGTPMFTPQGGQIITTAETDPSENPSTYNWEISHGAPDVTNSSTYNANKRNW